MQRQPKRSIHRFQLIAYYIMSILTTTNDDETSSTSSVSISDYIAIEDRSRVSIMNLINNIYKRSITEDDPRIETPSDIKIPLRPHQAAIVNRMYFTEKSLREGYEVTPGEKYFSRFAILGDAVGSGKSLAILSYLSYIKQNGAPSTANPPYYHPSSTSTTFSFVEIRQNQGSPINNLLIVPHTIYYQWVDYCKKQSSLNVFFCKTRRALQEPIKAKQAILDADLTLVSSTLYTELQTFSNEQGIQWERCFIDEVDTLYIPSTRPPITAKFTWFITATWLPIIQYDMYIQLYRIEEYYNIARNHIHPDYSKILRECITRRKPLNNIWRSDRFFRQYYTMHPHRIHNIIRTTDAFRETSISAPPIINTTLICRAPLHVSVISQVVTSDIQMALHAGDMDTVLMKLGINSDSVSNVINAVTDMQRKELARLRQTLEFKRGLDYATPQAKEAAITALEQKISATLEQIECLSKRIQDNNMCYICCEDLTGKEMVVPCCHNVFCAQCILTSIAYRPNCPMCRSDIKPADLCYLGESGNARYAKKQNDNRPSKTEQLLKLLLDNPTGRFIVFSRYDNPFIKMQRLLEDNNIRVAIINGNKDHIYHLQEKFRNGDVRVLLLNSDNFCAGMNLETASHVVLYHAGMTFGEEQQIIGRAYRMGREAPLNVVRLVHEGE
jgi:SNF2 family DNA or RNA helicase